LRARWVTLRARWVTLRARWVTLRARWVTLRAHWVTLRARWVALTRWWGTAFSQQAHETEDEAVLYAELLQIAAENLDRFTTVEDTTARVLGGGVNLRYEGRLCNVQQTVAQLSEEWDSPQLRLLAAAGISLEAMREACDDLVVRSEKFSELDVAQREAAAAEKQVRGWR
jgi:hypothetical protein